MNNKRIEAISQLIDNDESVIDIGCDHGFLAKMLRTKGNNKLIICSDNKIGPLNNARNNLIGYDNINFELTDGVDNIDTVCDVCVLAGMGHNTVISIIENNESYFRNCKKIQTVDVNTLSGISFIGMFYGCDNLTNIELDMNNANELQYMFKGCKNLKKVKFKNFCKDTGVIIPKSI